MRSAPTTSGNFQPSLSYDSAPRPNWLASERLTTPWPRAEFWPRLLPCDDDPPSSNDSVAERPLPNCAVYAMPHRPSAPVSPETRVLRYEYGAIELMSKYDRMRPAVRPANCTKPRSEETTSLVGAAPLFALAWKPPSKYDRNVPYSFCVRRSTVRPTRVRIESWLVSVRSKRPAGASPPPAPMPIGTPPLPALYSTCSRIYEPIFKHVSVPGTYQKPAPYRLQTLTYSTGLAFTGRSAACAPAPATIPAAEPGSRPFVSFILHLQLASSWEGSVRVRLHPERSP